MWKYAEKNTKEDIKRFRENFYTHYRNIKIIMKGKRRIGFYLIEKTKTTLIVKKLFISPAYQQKGIGNFLMNYFETLGYKKINIGVWKNNPAVNFYKKLNYEICSRSEKKYKMQKIL